MEHENSGVEGHLEGHHPSRGDSHAGAQDSSGRSARHLEHQRPLLLPHTGIFAEVGATYSGIRASTPFLRVKFIREEN